MASKILGPKSEEFALSVIQLYKNLCDLKNERVLSKQPLKSGTSIGANIAESKYAQSDADFISKLRIAIKEANESAYWLRLLYKSGYIAYPEYTELKNKCDELLKMLASSVKKMEEKEKHH